MLCVPLLREEHLEDDGTSREDAPLIEALVQPHVESRRFWAEARRARIYSMMHTQVIARVIAMFAIILALGILRKVFA